MFLLLLLSLSFEAVAVESSVPTACTHVLEFIEVLVPAKNRELLIGRWRVFLGTKLRAGIITQAQYNILKSEIIEAQRIIAQLEAKGHRNNAVIGLAYFHCSI
ncbi:MAG: hypothetical protein ACKJRP_04270 [SAR86 cluster bacterium]